MRLEGHYIRITPGDSAEIRLTPMMMGTDRYHVTGLALWGEGRETGPNMGELDFTAELYDDRMEHSDGDYRVEMHFRGDTLEVLEENWRGVHGMNVTFEGTYRRASAGRGLLEFLVRAAGRLVGR